jgi:hypothetical protein
MEFTVGRSNYAYALLSGIFLSCPNARRLKLTLLADAQARASNKATGLILHAARRGDIITIGVRTFAGAIVDTRALYALACWFRRGNGPAIGSATRRQMSTVATYSRHLGRKSHSWSPFVGSGVSIGAAKVSVLQKHRTDDSVAAGLITAGRKRTTAWVDQCGNYHPGNTRIYCCRKKPGLGLSHRLYFPWSHWRARFHGKRWPAWADRSCRAARRTLGEEVSRRVSFQVVNSQNADTSPRS